MGTFSRRHSYIHVELSKSVLENSRKYVASGLENLKGDPDNQRVYSGLAFHRRNIGLLSYALGFPIGDAIKPIQESVPFSKKVLELNGPGSETGSLGNPRSALYFSQVALAVGMRVEGEQLAKMIFDPLDPNYVDPHSSLNTTHERKVACAFRDLLLGDATGHLPELNRISLLWRVPRFPGNLAHQAGMMKAIADANRDDFLEALNALLRWHQTQALAEENRTHTDLFLCLAGMGLAALAVDRRVLRKEDLPTSNIFFPIPLIDASLAS